MNIIKTATLNTRTLRYDIKLTEAVKSAITLGVDVLTLQEVRRKGTETLELNDDSLQGWQLVKVKASVALLLATHVNQEARIMATYIKVKRMRVFIINAYSPTEVSEDSTKDKFYCNLRKSIKEASNKQFLLGD